MTDPNDPSFDPGSRRDREYQDPHYHDDDEVDPVAPNDRPGTPKPPARRTNPRRMPPPRRRYED